ncbi:MAG: hypothetical protein H0X64_06275 [Gemmatimonadaceae bacterium]|nr:hypothetical protein [Gemmatimonadaceae bacterium]
MNRSSFWSMWAASLPSVLLAMSWPQSAAAQIREPVPAAAAVRTSDWLADFAHLKDALTRAYANLDWAIEQRGMRLPELALATEAAIRQAPSDSGARAVIDAFLGAFGDGHLEVRWAARPAATSVPSAKDPAPRPLCARLGYQRARRGGGVRFELLPGFRWLPSPDSVYFPAGIMVDGDDRLGVLRIASFEDNIHPELCEAAARGLGLHDDAPCDSACAARVPRDTGNQLTAALERRVASLQAAGITRLLVDVTRNGGGTNWVEAAARTLTPVPLRGARMGFLRHPHYVRSFDAQIESLRRDSVAATPQAQAQVGRALVTLRQQRREADKACDRSALWEGRPASCSLVVTEPPRYSTGLVAYAEPGTVDAAPPGFALFSPARYRYREGMYRGPLLVLIDGGTASAAEYFTALVMDNSAGVVVGAPTYGAGCGYTNGGIRLVLPHSGGRVMVPDCVRLRASGSNEVEGIAPDMPVPWRRADTPLQRARRVFDTVSTAR